MRSESFILNLNQFKSNQIFSDLCEILTSLIGAFENLINIIVKIFSFHH